MKRSNSLASFLLAAFSCALLLPLGGCGGTSSTPSSNLTSPNATSPGASSGGSSSGSGGTSSGGSSGTGSSGSGSPTPSPTTNLTSFLYVGVDDGSSSYGGSSNTGNPAIAAFGIGPDGSLLPTPGSPYAGGSAALAGDAGTVLYAASGSTLRVNRINSDGSLATTATLNSQPLTPSIGIYADLAFDRSTQTLYATALHGAGDNFWEIYKSDGNGSLFVSGSEQDTPYAGRLDFSPSGIHVYQPYCYHLEGNIFIYTVGSDGKLTLSNSQAYVPMLGGLPACPYALAVSPDGKYVAAALNSKSASSAELGIYGVNADGSLTPLAGSPYPRTAVGGDITWDPSGRFIALAAKDGLWVYNFVAGTAPVPLTGAAIAADAIDYVAFNRSGSLLFATSSKSDALYVFNFNSASGGATPAPGSPHKMNLPPYELVVAER